jgi:hypothetical protein
LANKNGDMALAAEKKGAGRSSRNETTERHKPKTRRQKMNHDRSACNGSEHTSRRSHNMHRLSRTWLVKVTLPVALARWPVATAEGADKKGAFPDDALRIR